MSWKMPFFGGLIIAAAALGLWALGGGATQGHAERRIERFNFRPQQVERVQDSVQVGGLPAKGLRLRGPQGELILALSEPLLVQAAQVNKSAVAPRQGYAVQARWEGQPFQPRQLQLTLNRVQPDLSLLDLRLQGEFAAEGNPEHLVSIDLPLLITTAQ